MISVLSGNFVTEYIRIWKYRGRVAARVPQPLIGFSCSAHTIYPIHYTYLQTYSWKYTTHVWSSGKTTSLWVHHPKCAGKWFYATTPLTTLSLWEMCLLVHLWWINKNLLFGVWCVVCVVSMLIDPSSVRLCVLNICWALVRRFECLWGVYARWLLRICCYLGCVCVRMCACVLCVYRLTAV